MMLARWVDVMCVCAVRYADGGVGAGHPFPSGMSLIYFTGPTHTAPENHHLPLDLSPRIHHGANLRGSSEGRTLLRRSAGTHV